MGAVAGYRREPAGSQPPLLHPAYKSTVPRAPGLPPLVIPPSLSEVTGPLFGQALVRANDTDLTRQGTGQPQGERIVVAGRVLDQDGRPIPDALIEIWQAKIGRAHV